MLLAPKTIETYRLILRCPTLADAGAIFASYAQDEQVTRYLSWVRHSSIRDTVGYLKRCADVWANATAFPWVITKKEDKQLIGMIELLICEYRAELAYVLAKPYWKNGYMSEAAQAVIEWAQSQPSIYRIWAVCDVSVLAQTAFPIIPDAAMTVFAALGYSDELPRWPTGEARDILLQLPAGQRIMQPPILFRKVEDAEIVNWTEQFGGATQE